MKFFSHIYMKRHHIVTPAPGEANPTVTQPLPIQKTPFYPLEGLREPTPEPVLPPKLEKIGTQQRGQPREEFGGAESPAGAGRVPGQGTS
jgi:hypothetical protein